MKTSEAALSDILDQVGCADTQYWQANNMVFTAEFQQWIADSIGYLAGLELSIGKNLNIYLTSIKDYLKARQTDSMRRTLILHIVRDVIELIFQVTPSLMDKCLTKLPTWQLTRSILATAKDLSAKLGDDFEFKLPLKWDGSVATFFSYWMEIKQYLTHLGLACLVPDMDGNYSVTSYLADRQAAEKFDMRLYTALRSQITDKNCPNKHRGLVLAYEIENNIWLGSEFLVHLVNIFLAPPSSLRRRNAIHDKYQHATELQSGDAINEDSTKIDEMVYVAILGEVLKNTPKDQVPLRVVEKTSELINHTGLNSTNNVTIEEFWSSIQLKGNMSSGSSHKIDLASQKGKKTQVGQIKMGGSDRFPIRAMESDSDDDQDAKVPKAAGNPKFSGLGSESGRDHKKRKPSNDQKNQKGVKFATVIDVDKQNDRNDKKPPFDHSKTKIREKGDNNTAFNKRKQAGNQEKGTKKNDRRSSGHKDTASKKSKKGKDASKLLAKLDKIIEASGSMRRASVGVGSPLKPLEINCDSAESSGD